MKDNTLAAVILPSYAGAAAKGELLRQEECTCNITTGKKATRKKLHSQSLKMLILFDHMLFNTLP